MDDNAALLEKATLLHQATQLHAAKGKGASGDYAQPGVEGVGVTSGPTPAAQEPDWVDKGGSMVEGLQGLLAKSHSPLAFAANPAVQQAVGKVSGYAGGLVRTLATQLAGMVTPGENPVGFEDWGEALTGNAKGVGDQAVRMGMPNPGFDIPGTNNKRLELKDAVNMVGNTLFDPLAHKGLVQKAGVKLYDSAIRPIEIAGEKVGKEAMGAELRKQKIRTPFNLRERIQNIVDKQQDKIEGFEKQASAGGGQINVPKAVAPAQAYVDNLARSTEEGDRMIARRLQKIIDDHKATAARPAEEFINELPYSEEQMVVKSKPASKKYVYDAPTESTGDLMQNEIINRTDAKGKPIVNTKPLKKKPGEYVINNEVDKITPGLPEGNEYSMELERVPKFEPFNDLTEPTLGPSPVQGAREKRGQYQKAKDIAYVRDHKNSHEQNLRKLLGRGYKVETEASIGQGINEGAQKAYKELNESNGKLLSTGKAQDRVSQQAQREFDTATSPIPSGTESLLAAIHSTEPEKALGSVALAKALRIMRLSAMPTGYALHAIDPVASRAAAVGNQLRSPWNKPDEEKK